jgi:hypothetical protein
MAAPDEVKAVPATTKAPMSGPLAVGLNVTLTTQLALAARPFPPIVQVVVLANTLPPNGRVGVVMLAMTNGPVPVFRTVNVKGELVVLIAWFPNPCEPGVSDMAGTVPVSVTTPEVAGAATFTFKVAVLVPVLVGVNVTLTVQFAPAARVAGAIGHAVAPVELAANWSGFKPVRVMLLIVSGALPMLVTVTD